MKVDHEETERQMLSRLLAMWSMEGSGGNSYQLGIVCPYCVGDADEFPASYVHFGKPQYFSGNDHYDARNVYGIDVRGDVIVLSFNCEEGGHEWVLVLGEHKGGIYCKIILTDDGSEPSPHFDSPIEQAFWDAWLERGTSFELIPQYPIGRYRVDFAELKTKTAIELDGHATHSSPDAIAYDRKRQREIEEQGWHVVRFGGKEIFKDVKECVEDTFSVLIRRYEKTEYWKQDIDRFNKEREQFLDEFTEQKN